jgi:hypothetical protein
MADTIRMKVGQIATLGITYKDAYGNVTVVDGTPVWASGNEALLVAGVDAAGNPTFTAVVPGTTQISAIADADMSEGVRELINSAIVEILPAEAVAGEINVVSIADVPVPAPTPEPAPVEPAPVEPAPVEPEPAPEPAPVEPEPAPVDPAPTPEEPTT